MLLITVQTKKINQTKLHSDIICTFHKAIMYNNG